MLVFARTGSTHASNDPNQRRRLTEGHSLLAVLPNVSFDRTTSTSVTTTIMARQNRNVQRDIIQSNQGRRQAMQQRLRQKKNKQAGPQKDFLDDVVVPGTVQETPPHEDLHHQIIEPGTIMVSNANGICIKNKSGNCGKQAFRYANFVGKYSSGHRDFLESETNWTGKKLNFGLFQEEGSEYFSFVFSVILPPGMIIRTAAFGFHAAVAVCCGAHYVMKDPAQFSFGPTQDHGYSIRSLNWMNVDELLDPSCGFVDQRGNLTIEVAMEVYLIPPDELEELTKSSPSLLQHDNKVCAVNEPQLGGSKDINTSSSDSPEIDQGPLSATRYENSEAIDEHAQGPVEPDSPSSSAPAHTTMVGPSTLSVVSPTSVARCPRRKEHLPKETLEFRHPGFAGLDLERGGLIMLHPNQPGNHPWKLVIFPRGHSSSSNETEYVSCFLRSHSKSRGDITAKARILCNNHLTKIKPLKYNWKMEWGAFNWIKRSEILDANGGFLDRQGCLTITVEVRVRKDHK